MKSALKSVRLTAGELAAIEAAIGNFIEADDRAGAVGVFGSEAATRCAERVLVKVRVAKMRKK